MESNVRITDGTEVRYVTEAIANDKNLMRRFGFYKEPLPKDAPQNEVPKMNTSAEVIDQSLKNDLPDLLLQAEMSKNDIMNALKNAGIKFNPADKKEVLQKLLNQSK